MGFLDEIFGKKRKDEGWEEIPLSDSQKKSDQFLMDLLNRVVNFPTLKVPGMSPLEQQSQSLIGKYMNTGMPAAYNTGMGVLAKTAKGDYDPRTSPYYRGLREESINEENRAANMIRRGGQITTGTARHGPNIAQEARLRKDFSASRLSILGQLMERERDKQLSVAGPLMSASDYASQLPVRQAQTGMATGALPRQIETQQEQAVYEAMLKELLFPFMTQAEIAGVLLGQQRYAWDPGVTSPSIFSQIASAIPNSSSPNTQENSQMWAGTNTSPGFNRPTPSGSYYT